MGSLKYLLLVYASIFLINLTVFIILWRGSRVRYYRDMGLAWLAVAGVLVASGVTANMSFFPKIAAFSISFFFYSGIAKMLADIIGLPFPRRLFLSLLGGALLAALFTDFFNLNVLWGVIPVSLATGLPSLYFSFKTWGQRWKTLSTTQKGASITVFLNGLHNLDYWYAYGKPELLLAGFTVGVILVIACTLFFPAVILEDVAKKSARLEADFEYKSKLTQASKLASIGEMAGGVAHEINSPLAIIQITAEQIEGLLAGENLDRGLINDRLDTIIKTVGRISRIIQGLRTFSRNGSDLPRQVVKLSQIIEDTLGLCQERFRVDGISVSVENDGSDDSVLCNPVEISQVLLNLLSNARDAVLETEKKWVKIHCRSRENQIEIAVIDSGSGVSKENQEKIFQPFFTTKALGRGTGLGLSISFGIIESHGGKLTLDSNAANTTFVITLPKLAA